MASLVIGGDDEPGLETIGVTKDSYVLQLSHAALLEVFGLKVARRTERSSLAELAVTQYNMTAEEEPETSETQVGCLSVEKYFMKV